MARRSEQRRKYEQAEEHVVAATEAQNNFGRILDLAQSGNVIVKKFNRPAVVVISSARYEIMKGEQLAAERHDLDAMAARFDAMVAAMQTDRAGAAVDALFAASGQELGKVARKAAARRPGPAGRRG